MHSRTIKFMTGYAVSALLLALANITITATTYPDFLVTQGRMGRIVLEAVALPWPIIVIALINLESCKRACAGQQPIPKAKAHHV